MISILEVSKSNAFVQSSSSTSSRPSDTASNLEIRNLRMSKGDQNYYPKICAKKLEEKWRVSLKISKNDSECLTSWGKLAINEKCSKPANDEQLLHEQSLIFDGGQTLTNLDKIVLDRLRFWN